MAAFNARFPSAWAVSAPHTSSYSGGSTVGHDENGLLYDATDGWVTSESYTNHGSYNANAWGKGAYHYTNPIPKGVRYVNVGFKISSGNTNGSHVANAYITNSSGAVVANTTIDDYSGTLTLNVSSYVWSQENLYLHVNCSSGVSGNIGLGNLGTSARITGISFTY